MPEILNPRDNPHKIALYYTTKGDFATITLDLSKSKITLTEQDKHELTKLPLKKATINNKKAVLVTLRDNLLDATEKIMSILVEHTR